jgi:hypothetical protein
VGARRRAALLDRDSLHDMPHDLLCVLRARFLDDLGQRQEHLGRPVEGDDVQVGRRPQFSELGLDVSAFLAILRLVELASHEPITEALHRGLDPCLLRAQGVARRKSEAGQLGSHQGHEADRWHHPSRSAASRGR